MIMCRGPGGGVCLLWSSRPTYFLPLQSSCVCACARVGEGLQEVLLDPHRLLLLVQYALSDDADEFVNPGPGLGFHAGVETRDDLQLFLLRPT